MVKRDTLATYCLTIIIVFGIGEGERKQISFSFGKAGLLKRYPIQIILVDCQESLYHSRYNGKNTNEEAQ